MRLGLELSTEQAHIHKGFLDKVPPRPGPPMEWAAGWGGVAVAVAVASPPCLFAQTQPSTHSPSFSPQIVEPDFGG